MPSYSSTSLLFFSSFFFFLSLSSTFAFLSYPPMGLPTKPILFYLRKQEVKTRSMKPQLYCQNPIHKTENWKKDTYNYCYRSIPNANYNDNHNYRNYNKNYKSTDKSYWSFSSSSCSLSHSRLYFQQQHNSNSHPRPSNFRLYALKNNNNNKNGYDFTQLLTLAGKSLRSLGKNVEGYLPALILILLFTGNLGFLLNLLLFSIAVPILGLVGTFFFLSSKIHVGPCPVCGQDNLGNSKTGSQIQCNSCQSIIETNVNKTTKKKEFILSDIDYNNKKQNTMNDIGGFSTDPMETLLQSLFGGMNSDNGKNPYYDSINGKSENNDKTVKKYRSNSKFRQDDDVIDVVAKSADNED